MSALTLLSETAAQGVCVRVDGRNLAVSPHSKLTDTLEAAIRDNKPALIEMLELLRREHRDDEWREIVADPKQLMDAASTVTTMDLRARGIVPESYIATVHCQCCGQDVPHFPVGMDTVGACVWCLNGQFSMNDRRLDRPARKRQSSRSISLHHWRSGLQITSIGCTAIRLRSSRAEIVGTRWHWQTSYGNLPRSPRKPRRN